MQAVIKEFFENTTIHGLSYLSTEHHFSKLFWALVVASAIAFEAFLINSSFLDWENDPVGTTIITLPISQIDFPKVTVCPPEGSNTALNFDLEAIGERNLTEEERQKLEQEVERVFVHQFHLQETANRVAMLNPSNIHKIFEDVIQFGEDFDIGMNVMEGTFTSPYFGEDVSPDTFKQDLQAHYKVSFPHQDYKSLLKDDDILFMKLSSTTSDHHRVEGRVEWLGPRIKLHKDDPKTWRQARKVCLAEGGDLASYPEFKVWEQHYRVLQKIFDKSGRVWVGGTDVEEEQKGVKDRNTWVWADGTPWSQTWDMFYKGFGKDEGDDGDLENCLAADLGDSAMINHADKVHYPHAQIPFRNGYDDSCSLKYPFLCSVGPTPLNANQNVSMTWTKDDLLFDSLHIWWSHSVSGWSLLDYQKQRMPGFKLEWGLEKAVSQEQSTGDGSGLLSSSSLILLTTGNCCEGILVASQVVLNEDVSGVYLMKETSDGGIVHQRTDGEFCTMNTRGKISGWFCCLCN